jgi:hypothetical protein
LFGVLDSQRLFLASTRGESASIGQMTFCFRDRRGGGRRLDDILEKYPFLSSKTRAKKSDNSENGSFSELFSSNIACFLINYARFVNIFEAVTISHKLDSVYVNFSFRLSPYSFAVQSALEAE